ncbi:hypothetical protein [Deinococcus arenicola]|uniref:Zinc ribbon domain-containing protein n=1 Tax=Deinococcus arenicola TaxID=2994950 RepID=A0ABU4DVR2_9DEIO|nr:hypothetical protein [Deinococcus sp. ZS9-10]MDV6376540.1 hypothetical protein [Deinococcus sp. ZS9-10]
MLTPFTVLERNILKAKGLSEQHLTVLGELGVNGRTDFQSVGSVATLLELLHGLDPDIAARVVDWALLPTGQPDAALSTPQGESPPLPPISQALVINSSDSTYCVHCQAKQPKDYSVGDLCLNCGLQAEPIETCYWCATSGPGRFCRNCGAAFVVTAELPLALLLRREGVAKDDISAKIGALGEAEKQVLWGRVRRSRR